VQRSGSNRQIVGLVPDGGVSEGIESVDGAVVCAGGLDGRDVIPGSGFFDGAPVGAHKSGTKRQIVGDTPVGVGADGDAVCPTKVGRGVPSSLDGRDVISGSGFLDGAPVGAHKSGTKRQIVGDTPVGVGADGDAVCPTKVGRGVPSSPVGSRVSGPEPLDGAAVGAHKSGNRRQIVGETPVGVGADGDAVSPIEVGRGVSLLLVGSGVSTGATEGAYVGSGVTVG
jgi:hypothetical protein